MINFRNTKFIKSTKTLEDAPKGRLPEILIVGRSNAGKSSLINALVDNKNLAFTSSKPGHTRLLNYYSVDDKFYLVDAPGYGYAKGGIDLDALFGEMMSNYLTNNLYLKCALLLMDSRREFNENDIQMIDIFKEDKTPFIVVLTKSDKLNQKEKSRATKFIESQSVTKYLFTSIDDAKSILRLRKEIEELI